MKQYISNARKPKHLIPQHMRIPLITPLASRNGAVEKDEKLVNCYGEQDVVTKETRVIKRAGLAPGNAVLSGPDIYGQGLFNYDGYGSPFSGTRCFMGM